MIFIQSNKKFQGCGLPQPFLLVGSTAEKKKSPVYSTDCRHS
ncbi:hypothetical protein CEV34_3014 [Brucella pseudogrignonensis]|uniref:Uncharacterized protein n=1 Tax=Brucella pseudogrignonensis TaxID=419475 RepID=A0A256GE05_9HYPH|nr:hypothetical protein CEV34_3014 [Brucella pseudogrignonensis]